MTYAARGVNGTSPFQHQEGSGHVAAMGQGEVGAPHSQRLHPREGAPVEAQVRSAARRRDHLDLVLLLQPLQTVPQPDPATEEDRDLHDVQVVEDKLYPSPTDIIVDRIATPTRLIEVGRRAPRPRGIKWELLEPEQIAATPPLQELRRLQGLAPA